MTARHLRTSLWIASVLMGAMACLSILWATAPLDRTSSTIATNGLKSREVLAPHLESIVNPTDLKQLCELDLRRPLHDPPPPIPPPPPPVQPPPPLNIRLSGTIIEPGHSQALIAMPDGSVQIKNIGESAGNAQIREIREGSITVEYFGQPAVLTVAQENAN